MDAQSITIVAIISLAVATGSALWIALDEFRHPQHMKIMNVVWPLTALYGGAIALWAYHRFGRAAAKQPKSHSHRITIRSYALATTHFGAGCTLGDLIAEWAMFFSPALLTTFGYAKIFSHKLFAGWLLDFVVAFALGIAVQYFTITPMRHLSPAKGLIAALKADTLSLIAWQVGMYGWMAVATFVIFDRELSQIEPVFWLMMQIAMLCGFLTSLPVNVWLVSRGIKERM